jgi:hypothetical protein
MSRIVLGCVLGISIVVLPILGQDRDRPKDKPAIPIEKIDGTMDRSLTGFIEKVEAKDGKNGTFVMRTSKDLPRYTFQVDSKTKILTAGNEALEAGLESPRLVRAEVRVLFIDRKPKEAKTGQPDDHLCRLVQIINPGK